MICSPTLSKSDLIEEDVVDVKGVMETIQIIPLRDFPEKQHVGADLNEFLYEITIGPHQNPGKIYDSLIKKLSDAGVSEPWKRVISSGIPLRR